MTTTHRRAAAEPGETCFDGCGHDRHVGPCLVAMADPDGPCGCGTPLEVGFLEELTADARVEYGDDELRDAAGR